MTFLYQLDFTLLQAPVKIRMLEKYKVPVGKAMRDIVQVVRAPNLHMSPRCAKDLWNTGDTYFPSLWVAPNDAYRKPATIIMLKPEPVIVDTYTKLRFDKNYQTSNYIVLLETGMHEIETYAVRRDPYNPPTGTKLLGVFKRVDIHNH